MNAFILSEDDVFSYSLLKGTVDTKRLSKPIGEGNCRLAVQLYFYKVHNLKLNPESVLCPRLYRKTGKFIKRKFSIDFFSKLLGGEIILAERIKDKNRNSINKSRNQYKNEDDWIVDLHSAVFIGQKIEKPIWHATNIEGRSCFWTIKKFLEYYRPVVAKRII